MNDTARLLITCPDTPGIVAAVAGFLHNHGANITALDQYSTDPEGGTFFMRLEFQTPYLDLTGDALKRAFGEVVASRFAMDWRITYASELKRTAILVSRQDHALMELLWAWKRGRLPTQVACVISNHPDLLPEVEAFGVPYHHVPVSAATKEEATARMLEILQGEVDLVVLARYMQIVTPPFVARYAGRMINIHHSFLPAFVGANPYAQAHERGVKIIGATAHYVTDDLDGGPIIEQDVVRVDHRHSVSELHDFGRSLERDVVVRAVRWHLEDRILIYGNKTVVFLS